MANRLATLTDFGRGFSRCGALTPLGVNAEFVFDAAEPFLERAETRHAREEPGERRARV